MNALRILSCYLGLESKDNYRKETKAMPAFRSLSSDLQHLCFHNTVTAELWGLVVLCG